MKAPQTYTALEDFGRVRLSKHYYMRNFLYSEIANVHAIPNVPHDPDDVIAAGTQLAQNLLDPLHETFGSLAIRSGYRSPSLNHFGATQVRPQKCSANDKTLGGHIWGRDAQGRLGACVSIAIPWFADRYDAGRDWRDLAWWLYDHLMFQEIYFFPKMAAFNLTWREEPEQRMLSYIKPKGHLRPMDAAARKARYADFPPFRGIQMP